MNQDIILIIGSCGQVGTELTEQLRLKYGKSNVICTDLKKPDLPFWDEGVFEICNVLDKEKMWQIIAKYKPTQIYHLAALLSATAEKNPKLGWELNMDGLFIVFDAALEYGVKKVFWPSSIAVFGPNTPQYNTPQYCTMDPNTIYGITKLAGERYCEYYFNKYGLDVRSIRYPGLIGYKSAPGGGTTDYAVTIFHEAKQKGTFECFLNENTELPMLYMSDAIKATIDIMEAPAKQIKIRSSYNLAGFSFTPHQLSQLIKNHIPNFEISYKPDHRQAIADSWPKSIDDTCARKDWGWQNQYQLDAMVKDMLDHI